MLGKIIGPLGCGLLLAGCFSVEVAKSPVLGPDVEAHVVVSNYGWSLFGCVPIVCGNKNLDSWCPFTFFQDEVKLADVRDCLQEIANASGCDTDDVTVLADNDVLFDAYYAPVPWIVVYHEANVSAHLVRKEKK